MTEHVSRLRLVRAVALLPFVVTVIVPAVLLLLQLGATPVSGGPRWVGITLGTLSILAGLTLMGATIRLLAQVGGGTLAPWDPTVHLVVAGPYRHVRNPMISGVFAVLAGETMIFVNTAILLWFCLFLLGNLAVIPRWEEPGLRLRFGADYDRYCRNVPRWIPRLTAWESDPD